MKNIRLHLTTTQRLPLNIFGHHIQPVQGKQEHSVGARYILTECVNAKKENLENSPYVLLTELIIQILWSKKSSVFSTLPYASHIAGACPGHNQLSTTWQWSTLGQLAIVLTSLLSFIHSFIQQIFVKCPLYAWNTEGVIKKHGPCPLAAFSQKKIKQINKNEYMIKYICVLWQVEKRKRTGGWENK